MNKSHRDIKGESIVNLKERMLNAIKNTRVGESKSVGVEDL